MLQEAIELQQNAVSEVVAKAQTQDAIVFKAPTGSGKTFMMADLMNRILDADDDVVFLVSTLSKGDLAGQNYYKFCDYVRTGKFPHLKPFLISTEVSKEERLCIPTDYNVYVLPRDLYREGGLLMQGVMDEFLQSITGKYSFKLGKDIYVIKDECHQATNNLDNLSSLYFSKTFYFSATPNLARGQHPDVEITYSDAEHTKLIKSVEEGKEEDTVDDALLKFEEIKTKYRNLLGVNPCLIIQISNRDQGTKELNDIIYPELAKHPDLKWMLIVDKDADCQTNDVFKAKKLPVLKWKDYAKEDLSSIDVIIFKMVISEGWDIPRACMLYQMREVQSPTLGEQVIGRVRRNPRLLDFETLSPEAQKLAMTAWVWANIDANVKKSFAVRLWDEPTDITDVIRIKTTKLKPLSKRNGFDIDQYLKTQGSGPATTSVFEAYKMLDRCSSDIKEMCYEYALDDVEKWYNFAEHSQQIQTEANAYQCNYASSMELTTDEEGKTATVSFPVTSCYLDNGNYSSISDWVWKRKDGKDKFSFDSEAEKDWADILDKLSVRAAKEVAVGKSNPKAGMTDIEGNDPPAKLNAADKYLWGKNYLLNSEIKFEYCLDNTHFSYPDFVMMDRYHRIHIFEVKSVNVSNATPAAFDAKAYKKKIAELEKCYQQASLLTEQIFYLPVKKDDDWFITRLQNGTKASMTLQQFKEFVKAKP